MALILLHNREDLYWVDLVGIYQEKDQYILQDMLAVQ
jgi:hypothetical protein